MYEFKEKSLTMRSSGLGGCNRKGVGGFFGLSCMWFQRSPVEAPNPLNAGVVRCIPGGRRLAMSERFGQWTSGQAGPDNRTHRLDWRDKAGRTIRRVSGRLDVGLKMMF